MLLDCRTERSSRNDLVRAATLDLMRSEILSHSAHLRVAGEMMSENHPRSAARLEQSNVPLGREHDVVQKEMLMFAIY